MGRPIYNRAAPGERGTYSRPWWLGTYVSCHECGLEGACPHAREGAVRCDAFVPTFVYFLKNLKAYMPGQGVNDNGQ